MEKVWSYRSAFEYLYSSGVYSLGREGKKQQQVFLKGGSGYICNQHPYENKKLDTQRVNNLGHLGAWKKYGGLENTRSFRWSAQAIPPVSTNFDHFVDDWGSGHVSYTTAKKAVENQELMDR